MFGVEMFIVMFIEWLLLVLILRLLLIFFVSGIIVLGLVLFINFVVLCMGNVVGLLIMFFFVNGII